MRIKKMYQGTVPENKILDTYSTSATDTYSCNYVNGLETYSTSETRVGTWIDGKPIYRKIYTISLGSDSNIFEAHNLSNLDKFWINNGISFVYKSDESIPANWYYSSSDWARTWLTNNHIRFRSPSNLTGRTLYITIEYTKTTDV